MDRCQPIETKETHTHRANKCPETKLMTGLTKLKFGQKTNYKWLSLNKCMAEYTREKQYWTLSYKRILVNKLVLNPWLTFQGLNIAFWPHLEWNQGGEEWKKGSGGICGHYFDTQKASLGARTARTRKLLLTVANMLPRTNLAQRPSSKTPHPSNDAISRSAQTYVCVWERERGLTRWMVHYLPLTYPGNESIVNACGRSGDLRRKSKVFLNLVSLHFQNYCIIFKSNQV